MQTTIGSYTELNSGLMANDYSFHLAPYSFTDLEHSVSTLLPAKKRAHCWAIAPLTSATYTGIRSPCKANLAGRFIATSPPPPLAVSAVEGAGSHTGASLCTASEGD